MLRVTTLFLDNGIVDVDLGLGLRRLDSGKSKQRDFTATFPVVNAEVTVFDDSDFSVFGRIDAGANGSSDFKDAQVGVRYNLYAGFKLQAGYRHYELNLDTKGVKQNATINGLNAGIHWAF